MNMHLPSLYTLALGLILLTTACGGVATVRPSPTPAQTLPAAGNPVATSTPKPTATTVPTPTVPVVADTPTPVATPTPKPKATTVPTPTVQVAANTPTPPPSAGPVFQADIIDFILPDITLDIGATVHWTNLDAAGHTATSGVEGIYDGSGWDSRGLALNESFSHQFQQEGVFAYTCRFHPWMNATVTVVAGQSSSSSDDNDDDY